MKQITANGYQERARHLLKLGGIGAVIGLAVTIPLLVDTGAVMEWLFLGILFADIPYGWKLSDCVFNKIAGSILVIAIALVFHLVAAYIIGLMVYPLVLIYNLVRGYILCN